MNQSNRRRSLVLSIVLFFWAGLAAAAEGLKSGFRSQNGTTVLQYCVNKRIDAARLLLNENKHSISEIADIVGYQDHSAFSRAFRRLSGCTPREWRQARTT